MTLTLPSACVKLSIGLLTTLLVSSVLCRGMEEHVDKCQECWASIGRLYSGVDVPQSGIQEVIQHSRSRSDLLSLLLNGEATRSKHHTHPDCSPCWLMFFKLATEIRQRSDNVEDNDDDASFESFNKRGMLNNGWTVG